MTDPFPGIEQDSTAWALAGDQLIFLDILRDRYLCLSDEANAGFIARIDRGELAAWHVPACLPKPEGWIAPRSGPPALRETPFSIAGVAAALWMQRRLEFRLRTIPFHRLLAGVRDTVERRAGDGSRARTALLPAIIDDFERARLLRGAANRCVPRSLAVVLRCATHGMRAHAVIGVRSRPFEAHCWAQLGPGVLTDPLEDVAPYTPILVI